MLITPMDTQVDNILNALPEATNHTHLLLQMFHRTQLTNIKPRNESTCKKCLTPWSSGQFTVKLQPSNHNRKKRRQHRIDKLQKALKDTDKKSEIVKRKRQIEHLQKQNNHVAMYKCEICKTTTSVQCWKPKKLNKQDNHESSVTSGVLRKEEEEQPRQKHEELTNKPKKNKGKKKKTAGLIIPPLLKTTQQASTVAHYQQSLSMAKLSNMLQLQQSSSKSQTMSKLNQFLK